MNRLAPPPLRLALGALALLYVVNFGILGFLVGPHDFDHLSAYYELAWRFWREGQLFPHYNPFFCGGQTLAGNPQVPIFHPLVLFVPILGPTWVIKLEMLAQLAFGAWGLGQMLRRFGATGAQRAFGISVFAAGGGVVARFLVGHVTLGFYFLYPLLLELSYRLSDPDAKKPYVSYFALFLYCGLYKPNFLIYGVPPLAIEALARSVASRDARPLAWLMFATVFSGLGSAVTLLPASQYFRDFPRIDDLPTKYIPPYALLANLLLPLKAIPKALYGSGFLQRHEYNQFVGPVALFFAWLGGRRLWRNHRPEAVGLFVFALVSVWIGLGATETGVQWHLPFSWLRETWPGFKSVRVPVRFWFSVTVTLSVLAALGFRWPTDKRKQGAIVALGLAPLLLPAAVNLSKPTYLAEKSQWAAPRLHPEERVWVEGSIHEMLPPIRRGEGVLSCVFNLETNQSPYLEPGPQLPIGAEWESWSVIRLDRPSHLGQRLTFNLNHSPYWRYEGEDAVIVSEPRDRLQIESLGEKLEGRLVFEQPRARQGALVSAVTLLLALALLAYSRYLRKR